MANQKEPSGQKPLATDAESLDRLLAKFLRRYGFVTSENIESFTEKFASYIKAHTLPRDPFHLLPALGIKLERTFLPPPERATWEKIKGSYLIYHSRHQNTATANFALWRVFFQILAQHPHFPTNLSDWWQGRLGNKFASIMLMPKAQMVRLAERFKTNPDCLVPVLANKFATSWSAMRKRLYELGILRPGHRYSRPRG